MRLSHTLPLLLAPPSHPYLYFHILLTMDLGGWCYHMRIGIMSSRISKARFVALVLAHPIWVGGGILAYVEHNQHCKQYAMTDKPMECWKVPEKLLILGLALPFFIMFVMLITYCVWMVKKGHQKMVYNGPQFLENNLLVTNALAALSMLLTVLVSFAAPKTVTGAWASFIFVPALSIFEFGATNDATFGMLNTQTGIALIYSLGVATDNNVINRLWAIVPAVLSVVLYFGSTLIYQIVRVRLGTDPDFNE